MAVHVRIDGQSVFRSEGWPAWDSDALSAAELFQWACFLDQGESLCVSRRGSVEALLEVAGNDRQAVFAAYLFALRALRQARATRGVVDLLKDALELVD